MAKNKFKQKSMKVPIENHRTASWSNIEKLESKSNVPIPDEHEVENAKKWVEKNQK
jgi:hypothetical protein